jgi:hypothetical protein
MQICSIMGWLHMSWIRFLRADEASYCVLLVVWNRATAIFIAFCLTAAIVLYVTPFQVVAVLLGVYILRHPRFRDPLPPVPWNFFGRLPSQADRIL